MKLKNIIATLILLGGCSSPENGTSTTNSAIEQPTFLSSFDYQPEAPVNGKLLGIIELGYTGFNSFIVRMDDEDRWALEKATYGESKIGAGAITFELVTDQIEKFKKEMIEFGVAANDINLVASSSALRDRRVVEIADGLRRLNIGLITVSAEQEGNYALLATVPKEFTNYSFMVDIGSGNTKISWIEGREAKSVETYGSLYLESGISDQEARIGIKEALASVPDANRSLCFMVGKIPFLLASATNNRNKRYTILESPEAYDFDGEQEQAGLNLYDALWQESTVSYIFDWDSNFSIGVLMNVN